jgi:hypothetical protein
MPSKFLGPCPTAAGTGFYGINVGETDDSPLFAGIDTIKFEFQNFYVTQNSPNTDTAIINFRGQGDPEDFRNFSYECVEEIITIPRPQQMVVHEEILIKDELRILGTLVLEH